MPIVSTVVPTRGRPNKCKQMIESWIKNTKDSELIIYYQTDDQPEALEKYKQLESLYNHPNIKWSSGERFTSGMIWNKLYEDYATAPIIHLGSDDLHYKTKNWDQEVQNVTKLFPDEVYCISVREGGKEDRRGRICRHPVVSRKMIDTLGFFHPPFFIHYNVDIYWRDICDEVGRFVIMGQDVLIGHVRDDASKEYDWREEFYHKDVQNHKTNYIWSRDKYVTKHIKRYKQMDVQLLRSIMQ